MFAAHVGAPRRSSAVKAVVVALALCAGCASARSAVRPAPWPQVAQLRRSIDSLVAAPQFRTMTWGILIVDPARGDTLYARNADKLFIPASNQKILTGAVALHLLGPEYRFVTTIATSGAIQDSVVRGDLVIVGSGDPSMSDHMAGDAMRPMFAIADSLAARGVRRVAGALKRGGDAFPDATLGFGWAWDDLEFPYSAGVDELFFNEGFARIQLIGGRGEGAPVLATSRPAGSYPRLTVRARTVAPGLAVRRGVGAPRVRYDSADTHGVIVEGDVATGDTVTLAIAYRDQRAAFLGAAREALAARGIAVDSGATPLAVGEATYPLFAFRSPPLREILAAFEKPSQNQIGEVLLKTLGRQRAGVGSADSGVAVVRRQLLDWGARPDGFVVRDGSGLSRHNVVTPETIVRVLDRMRGDTAFAAFYDALPIAGVDGTIAGRMRGTPAERNVRAKTGTLDMVRSLSGYVTSTDGRTLIFSMLANNWTVPVREIERVQDAIAVLLARLTLDRSAASR